MKRFLNGFVLMIIYLHPTYLLHRHGCLLAARVKAFTMS
uniref:Uncharacterized protein n=1 Tax=Anguilla anguilla TaxID=7936 RepID=A0A0E9XZT1_ANGAN